MVAFWRQAGLNYIQYSQIAAKALRRALKPDFREKALKAEETLIKVAKWEGGKIVTRYDKAEDVL